MKKSVAVLGLGEFGKSLAENLYKLGADVLAVDCSEEVVQDFSDKCTSAVCADLSDESEVTALGLKNMDIVVSTVCDNLAASIMAVTVAKEQGVPLVLAKSASGRMASILSKVGADKVVNPEAESGARMARILLSSSFKNFFEIDGNMYMIELIPKKEWIGKSLGDLNLREKMSLNVVAEKEEGGLWRFPAPREPITEKTILLIVIEKKNLKMLQ